MQYINQAVQYIIRPTRDRYHANRLGPTQFLVKNMFGENVLYSRQDTQINFHRKKISERIQVSVYHPETAIYVSNNQNVVQPKSCVIYLHANNGSRIEPLPYIYPIISNKNSCSHMICTFDSVGSGMSSGDHITLGLNQSDDLYQVVKYLSLRYGIKKFLLWGRSMGACSAIMFSQKYFRQLAIEGVDLMGMILDSPFSDLKQLVRELASERTSMPQFIFGPFLFLVERKLRENIDKSFDDYEIDKYLENSAFIPALFMVSKNDKLVKAAHCQQLYEKYACKNKELYYIEDQHHQNRSEEVVDKCLQFISRAFNCPKKRKHLIGHKQIQTPQQPSEQPIYKIHDYEQEKRNNKKFSFQSSDTVMKQPIQFSLCPNSKRPIIEENNIDKNRIQSGNKNQRFQSNKNIPYSFRDPNIQNNLKANSNKQIEPVSSRYFEGQEHHEGDHNQNQYQSEQYKAISCDKVQSVYHNPFYDVRNRPTRNQKELRIYHNNLTRKNSTMHMNEHRRAPQNQANQNSKYSLIHNIHHQEHTPKNGYPSTNTAHIKYQQSSLKKNAISLKSKLSMTNLLREGHPQRLG